MKWPLCWKSSHVLEQLVLFLMQSRGLIRFLHYQNVRLVCCSTNMVKGVLMIFSHCDISGPVACIVIFFLLLIFLLHYLVVNLFWCFFKEPSDKLCVFINYMKKARLRK